MAITIEDILLLEEFSECTILTGKNNLDSILTTVTVVEAPLDEPWIAKSLEQEVFKYPGDFNISLLYAYRERKEEILKLIKVLVREEASALCILDGVVDMLPQEAIDYAESCGFPIMLLPFDVTYAHIITRIMEMIIKDQKDLAQELRIKELLNSKNSAEKIREISRTINEKFEDHHIVAKVKLLDHVKKSPIWLWDLFKNKNRYSVFKFEDYLLCVFTFKEDTHEALLEKCRLILERLSAYDVVEKVGVSSLKEDLIDLPSAIKESEIALKFSKTDSSTLVHYDKMGIYQLLLPLRSNEIFVEFSNRIVQKILDNEKHNKELLLNTVQVYVNLNCNTRETALALDIHENSVRYRLNQIREILDSDLSYYELDELLSIALKIYNLNNLK